MLILHMTRDPEIKRKVLDDYQECVIKPYLEDEASPEEKSGKVKVDLDKALNFDRTFDLKYFNYVY